MEDKLTIALPVYKRTQYIRAALDSAVNQTVKCRVLVVDNNSPHDEFRKIVEDYNNPLIKYIKTDQTVSMVENFNNCIRFAETPWLTILHDDDLLHFQFAELAQLLLKKYENKIGGFVVASQVSEEEWKTGYEREAFTDDIKVVKEPYFYFAQLTPFPGVMVHRETALKLGGFDAMHYPMEDFDFWYRYCTKVPMLYVNQKFAYYRISPLQDTVDSVDVMINNVYTYRRRLIKEGRYNNFLTKLALEHSRINNINYYKNTYPDLEITHDIIHEKALRRAEKLLKVPYISKLIWLYRKHISFGKINF